MGAFDDETLARRLDERTWSTHVHGAWCIGDTPNGGYVVSSVVRALAEATGRAAPLSMTTHYLRPTLADADATIHVDVIRQGRAATTATATLTQDDTERLRVLAAFGDPEPSVGQGPRDRDDEIELTIPPVALPPPNECVDRADLDQAVALPILDRLHVRVHPDHATAGTADHATISGWVRFADGTPPSAVSLPLFADAFPPSLLPLIARVGWVPTIELTVHVRRHPAEGWIRASFECDDLAGSRLIESGTLWDSTGGVIARSRQLGLRRDR